MRCVFVLLAFVALASAAFVKRDVAAPANSDWSTAIDNLRKDFEKLGESFTGKIDLSDVWKNTQKNLKDTIDKATSEINAATPELKAKIEKIRDEATQTVENFKKQSATLTSLDENLKGLVDNIKKNTELDEQANEFITKIKAVVSEGYQKAVEQLKKN